MQQMELKVSKTEATNRELELLNSDKDTFYDTLPMRFIDIVEDFDFVSSEKMGIKKEQLDEANILMRAPFAFYGGYAQLSANAKDQMGESYMLQYLLNQISELK